MSHKYAGGCDHVHVYSDADPIDNHECHCFMCKTVTGQHTTHVVFFNHGDLKVDHPELLKRVPFGDADGPLEICLCNKCDGVIMLDDKEGRIRVAVPNVMGYADGSFPGPTYHAFWDESKGYAKPNDGRPVYDGLRPDFVWPAGS